MSVIAKQPSISKDQRPFLLRVKQVETLYEIPRSTLYEMIARGDVPVVRLGRAVRIPRDDLEEFIRSRSERIR